MPLEFGNTSDQMPPAMYHQPVAGIEIARTQGIHLLQRAAVMQFDVAKVISSLADAVIVGNVQLPTSRRASRSLE